MHKVSIIILIIMAIMSLIGFCSMGIDKAKAKKGAWRIPEKTLFAIAILGGGIGSWIGMQFFRHKTKHWYFKYGIPAICIFELIAVGYALLKIEGILL